MVPLGSVTGAGQVVRESEQISYDPNQPPPEYVFVPKGDVYVTRHCRTMSNEVGKTLYVVYDTRSKKTLGIHCHSQISQAVQADAAATADQRQQAVAAKDSRDYQENRKLLLDNYPGLPTASIAEILKHGFLKGSGRVGRAKRLDDCLRVDLAVNSHIRHKLTPYDSILSSAAKGARTDDTKRKARGEVHDQIMRIANSWREKSRPSSPKELKDSKAGKSSATQSAIATLATNRSRRSAQTKPPPAHQATPHEESLKIPKLTGPTKQDRQAKLMQETLSRLSLAEDSGLRLSRKQLKRLRREQRRYAELQKDIEQLRLNPDHVMTDTRMARVLEKYHNDGEKMATLSEAVKKRLDSQTLIRAEKRRGRWARRTAAKEAQIELQVTACLEQTSQVASINKVSMGAKRNEGPDFSLRKLGPLLRKLWCEGGNQGTGGRWDRDREHSAR